MDERRSIEKRWIYQSATLAIAQLKIIPWKATLTFEVAAGPVRNKVELQRKIP
jgi:hypothetical protein